MVVELELELELELVGGAIFGWHAQHAGET